MRFIILLAGILILWSCEQEFIPDIDSKDRLIIVEGHIEKGEEALPPYVLLSHSLPFLDTINGNDLAESQINNAEIYVHYKNEVYALNLLCLSDLPPDIREAIINEIGLIPDMDERDFCVYIDLMQNIPVEIGGNYGLRVLLDNGDTLKSSTSIPEFVPIDSFRFTRPPGDNENDTLARLLCTISDPGGEENYYRYLTAGEGEPLSAGFGSVTDDAFFDGQTFEFPLQKAEDTQSSEEVKPGEFGLYNRGDTIRIKWMNIDAKHFEFWNSFEFNLNNQGPFSTYTRVNSNVEGALGIWGGYSSTIYTLVVPEEE